MGIPLKPDLLREIQELKSGKRYINYRDDLFIGRVDANGNVESDPTTGLPEGYVWVHSAIDSNADVPTPRTIASAKNMTTEYAVGAAVVVAFNTHTGENEVVGIDPIRGIAQYGAGAVGLNSPRKGASTPTPTSARDLITGGLYVHTGLTVRIGATRLPNGDDWDDTLTETLVPTATSGMKSLVLVAIDLTDNTFTTALTADRATTIPLISSGTLTTLGAADAKAVTSAQPDVWWVAAVELANGATSIDSAKIVDRRLWTFPTMTGATNTDDGVSGLVPTPEAGDEGKFLGGDGTWKTVSGSGSISVTDGVTTVNPATSVTFTSGATVTDAGSGVAQVAVTAGSGVAGDYILIRDEKAQNTSGGTFTSGAWQTRDLTTEVADTGNHASLSSNQITLAAGTYRAQITCPAHFVDRHQAKLYNVTDTADVLIGTCGYSANSNTEGDTTYSHIVGRFTLAGAKVLEVRHQCGATRATNGFGVACNFTTEVYTVVELVRE